MGLVDWHWTQERPIRLPPLDSVDLVILAGDQTTFLGRDANATLIDAIRERVPRVAAVCGNCDQPETETYFDEESIGLDRQARRYGRLLVAGLSGGLPFGGLPYERTEDDYRTAASEVFAAVDEAKGEVQTSDTIGTILVSHQPPYETACDLTKGRHVGSRSLRTAIEQHQPDLVFSGHIHEAVGDDQIGRSRIVNPGPWFRGCYLDIDLSGGTLDWSIHQVSREG